MPSGAEPQSYISWRIASQDALGMHDRRSTWVEEVLIQWDPENCTFGDALEQYNLGFDIVSIIGLKNVVSSQNLLPFVAAKRPTREQRRSRKRPPLSTKCIF